jgi:transitional endoplasmic reticulum ATPase
MKVELKVAEAHQDDVGKGIVRIDSQTLRELEISIGSPIGILGQKETVAICQRAYPSDLESKIIRMDGITRKNAEIGISENIKIYKINCVEAKKIILQPMQDMVIHPTTTNSIKRNLQNKPVVKGDLINISGNNVPENSQKKVNFSSNNPFAVDLFNSIEVDFLGFNLSNLKFKISFTEPNDFLIIGPSTKIEISNKTPNDKLENGVNYEDVGGLKSQLTKIRELVELPLKHPEIFSQLGIEPPKGILLYGPPGTGKTLIAKAIANETKSNFFSINAPEIVNKYYGESEKKLRNLFKEAEKQSPSIIFIDELDAIAQKREEIQGETEKRIVATLLTLMDGLKKSNKVIVIAATNMPDTLDGALRRPGRFDRELEIGIPKEVDRFEILQIHTRGKPLDIPKKFEFYEKKIEIFKEKNKNYKPDYTELKTKLNGKRKNVLKLIPKEIIEKVQKKENLKLLKVLSKITHGFVGADLEALVKEAAYNVVRRFFPEMDFNSEEKIPTSILVELELTLTDFKEALKVVRPSALREFLVEIPNVKWDDIGGLEDIKSQLVEMIEWPIKHSKEFAILGINSPKGILMYGPPGTGKTLLAKAVATETKNNFIYIKGPEIVNKYVGESEKAIRKIFQKARQNSPCILFFDEFDSIAKTRMGGENSNSNDNIVAQLLTEMDGLEELSDVKIITATNRPNLIDPALLRSGRLDKLVLVDIPDFKARIKILQVHSKNTPIENKNELIKNLAENLEGYVGADIENLIREAGLIALRENLKTKELKKEHFEKAKEVIKPSVNPELRRLYKKIEEDIKKPKEEKELLSMSNYD